MNLADTFQLVPAAARPDLDEREETKFLFEGVDPASLRCVLERRARRIEYAGPVSLVHSLYFDDARLSTARANLDGVGIRHKTRLRWYDSEHPEDRMFFERKWRRHRAVGKQRHELRAGGDLRGCSFGELRHALAAVLPEEARCGLAAGDDAVVVVSYRREHFLVDDGRARLTLDYDLRFSPQLENLALRNVGRHRIPGVSLIECKTAVGDRAALHGVLAPLRTRPARFSKYVTSVIAAGYLNDS